MKSKLRFIRKAGAFLSLFCIVSTTPAGAQCLYDDYSSAAPWTAGSGTTPPTVSGNQLNFASVPGAQMNYVYRSIGFTLNSTDNWTAEVDFTPTASGSNCPSHTILSLTAGTTNSWNSSTSGYPATNQDAIEAYYLTSYCGGSTTWQMFGCSKDGATWNTASTGINIDPAANPGTYYIRLERLSPEVGRLSIFSDAAFSTHISGSPQCFPIVNNTASSQVVTGLTHVQHGCIPQGSPTRTLTATIDNLNICNNSRCFDYSSASGWNQTSTTVVINTTGQYAQFSTTPDNSDRSVDFDLGNQVAHSTHWRAQTEFTPTAVSFVGPGHGILCLAEGSHAGLNIWEFSPVDNQDVIAAYYSCTPNGGSSTWNLYGVAKDGSTWSAASAGINLPTMNTTYYIVLERVDATNGRVAAYSDAAHLVLIGSQCFTIPSTVTGLNNLSHSNMKQGSGSRTMSARVDNTCVINAYLDGGTIAQNMTICSGTSPGTLTSVAQPSVYSCTGSTPSYQWELESPCGSGSWSPITGATSSSYTPGTLTVTSCYRRSVSGGLVPCSMTLYSNTVTITVTAPVANAGNDTTFCYSFIKQFGYTMGGNPSASGSTAPYTYSWSPTSNVSCPTCANPHFTLPPGNNGPFTYTLTVTDANGCTSTDIVTYTINMGCRIANPDAASAQMPSIAPNPTNGQFTISFQPGIQLQDIEVTNVLGQVVYKKQQSQDRSVEVDLSAQPKGTYFIKISSDGQLYINTVIVQ